MTAFFVTGSGTDIGKTWICAGLLGFWRRQGLTPDALKPVVTGFGPAHPEGSDPAVLLHALGRPATIGEITAMAPFRFTDPLSPDQAAAREGRRLSAAEIVQACAATARAAQAPLLIEGAGGIMSPLNEAETMLDLAAAFGAPVVFVAGSYLGALSHALTGLSVLNHRGLKVPLILINETPGSSVGLQATADSLVSHAPGIGVICLQRGGQTDAVWREVSAALGVPV